MEFPTPSLEHIADLAVQIGEPLEIGQTGAGERRVIPILGGTVEGPRLKGLIRPAGADFQIIRAGGLTELVARYVVEADTGALIYVENAGIRHGPPELIEKLRRGESVDPRQIYFRTVPRFEAASPEHEFLTRHVFIAAGARFPREVKLRIWLVA
jgi:hypothetical protein